MIIVMLVAAIVSFNWYADRVESSWVHTLAPATNNREEMLQRNVGSAMQVAAFKQPDLLPIYGSSELFISPGSTYNANTLFRNYPTGFAIFPAGWAGTTSLTILQAVAAVGPDARGKKVAISLSPPWFLRKIAPGNKWEEYSGNFSRLHAFALAFSTDLSFAVKQEAARRMVQYPDTLERDPVLHFALRKLADDSRVSHLLYWAVFPLGRLQTEVLRLQDHWEALAAIEAKDPAPRAVTRRPRKLDWQNLLNRARTLEQRESSNNPFGFGNDFWTNHKEELERAKDSMDDKTFLARLQDSDEWTDLDLLVRGLRDLGAEPVFISMPFPGLFYDYKGVSAQARSTYYEVLEYNLRPYRVPLFSFAEHDSGKYFLRDSGAHLGAVGWVYYSQVLDAFFHGRIHELKESR